MSTNSVNVTIRYKYKYRNSVMGSCQFFGFSGDTATCALFPIKRVTHRPSKLKKAEGGGFLRCSKCVENAGL